MCNKRAIEDEYHFILECDRYTDIRCKYIKKYIYYRNPSTCTFKLIQLLSVRNIKELNNIGKYIYILQSSIPLYYIIFIIV